MLFLFNRQKFERAELNYSVTKLTLFSTTLALISKIKQLNGKKVFCNKLNRLFDVLYMSYTITLGDRNQKQSRVFILVLTHHEQKTCFTQGRNIQFVYIFFSSPKILRIPKNCVESTYRKKVFNLTQCL